ncbi:MAG: ABC transporter ATP-binding protein [Candidatus Rokuibacteriota bacterium]|nr:MAG: ABC transporter ATP-binding protein [Candidatus Rokubacteria bacterium]
MTDSAEPLLAVERLSVEFATRDGVVSALEEVGFTIAPGETVGIVGESGSGKTVTALAIMGILDPAARVTDGRVLFAGADLLRMPEDQRWRYRGRGLSMVFQNARAALNPIRTVGRQLADVVRRHTVTSQAQVTLRVTELLKRVQIPDAERRYHAYPFELSGGMCQRVMIALAVAGSPALLIADEPTTGLDVTTQAAVLDLLDELARREQMAIILITHDLALAAERCDRIVVMHAGHVVETASARVLFTAPRHPYTARLIASTLRSETKLLDLVPIPGSIPDLRQPLGPCRYRARCTYARDVCDQPPLPRVEVAHGHMVACRAPL